MEFIPTTATAAEKLKRLAKQQRKCTGLPLAAELDATARANGYISWKHVAVCMKQTSARGMHTADLPNVLRLYLADVVRDTPPLAVSSEAARTGLVFAMDVKETDQTTLNGNIVECDDLWPVLARDIWRGLIYEKENDSDLALVERLEPRELLRTAQEDLLNYRFYRLVGVTPATLEDAFAQVFAHYFFHPQFVWLRGKYIDMAAVGDVRVDGRLVHVTTEAGLNEQFPPASDGSTPRTVDRPSSRKVIFRLHISKLKTALYETQLSIGGQEMDGSDLYPSISAALIGHADLGDDVAGVEVVYRGIVAGTYSPRSLRTEADRIAQHLVDTTASIRGA